MTNREFRDLMENILQAKPVFIKESGIKVLVTSYNKEKKGWGIKNPHNVCAIDFIDVPNKKAVDKTISYDLQVEEIGSFGNRGNFVTVNGKDIKINATIHISNLRALPLKTKGAEVLFGNQK